MGKSAAPRLGDFDKQGLAVEAACVCGHKRVIRPAFLLKFYGPETRLYPFVLVQLGARLRCHACEAHGPSLKVGRFGA
jgi:hypothetical protein